MKKTGKSYLKDRNSKCADVNPTSVSPTTSPNWILTNGIASGTEFSRRLGNKLRLSRLMFKYQIRPLVTTLATTENARLRVVVIYDRQANGAAPSAWSDIFSGRTGADTVAASTLSVADAMPNVDNRDRFIVLYDRVHQLQPTRTDASGYTASIDFGERLGRLVNKNMSLHGLPTYYSGTTDAVGSIRTGTVHIGVVSTHSSACQWEFLGARIYFNDAPQ